MDGQRTETVSKDCSQRSGREDFERAANSHNTRATPVVAGSARVESSIDSPVIEPENGSYPRGERRRRGGRGGIGKIDRRLVGRCSPQAHASGRVLATLRSGCAMPGVATKTKAQRKLTCTQIHAETKKGARRRPWKRQDSRLLGRIGLVVRTGQRLNDAVERDWVDVLVRALHRVDRRVDREDHRAAGGSPERADARCVDCRQAVRRQRARAAGTVGDGRGSFGVANSGVGDRGRARIEQEEARQEQRVRREVRRHELRGIGAPNPPAGVAGQRHVGPGDHVAERRDTKGA